MTNALVSRGRWSDRVLRCIVVAADGNERRLHELVELADDDDRDVLVAGEYLEGRRFRDLSESFLIDHPEKFWISQATWLLARRGYRLTTVSAHLAASMTELWNGSATFTGPKGQITIEKAEGRWTLLGIAGTTMPEGLTAAFGDERRFLDAVSGYLLTIS
ncbi:MAG: hypothetical protein NTV94_02550 [Planctomycetota bacterium]|nr:hypothetical protein [Planctomycetota bacterium]